MCSNKRPLCLYPAYVRVRKSVMFHRYVIIKQGFKTDINMRLLFAQAANRIAFKMYGIWSSENASWQGDRSFENVYAHVG